jgi:signal peptidase
MGNPVGVTDIADPDARTRSAWEGARFCCGLVGLFTTTTVSVLVLIAIVPVALPGWWSTVVSSGSMAPRIQRGDVVVARHMATDDLAEGSVIVFEDSTGGLLVHRVFDVDGGTVTTKGDANPRPDTAHVDADSLRGVGAVLVPWVGLPTLWWQEHDMLRLGAAIAVSVLALRASRWARLDNSDPWRRTGSVVKRPTCWLGVEVPEPPKALVTAATRSSILERARSCG